MDQTRAREFWDNRAEEDAFYFVDSRLNYGKPDLERFWAGGEVDLERFLGALEVRIEPTDHAVEIGCGVGRLTRVIARDAKDVLALDISERMLELAREHNPSLVNVSWIHGDGATLTGIESESADLVISHVVFQHIADPEVTLRYVREIGRVLRPGGWAGFQISNDPSVHRRRFDLGAIADAFRSRIGKAPRGRAHADWRGSYIDLDVLRKVAGEVGMDVERVVGEGTQLCLVRTRKRT